MQRVMSLHFALWSNRSIVQYNLLWMKGGLVVQNAKQCRMMSGDQARQTTEHSSPRIPLSSYSSSPLLQNPLCPQPLNHPYRLVLSSSAWPRLVVEFLSCCKNLLTLFSVHTYPHALPFMGPLLQCCWRHDWTKSVWKNRLGEYDFDIFELFVLLSVCGLKGPDYAGRVGVIGKDFLIVANQKWLSQFEPVSCTVILQIPA